MSAEEIPIMPIPAFFHRRRTSRRIRQCERRESASRHAKTRRPPLYLEPLEDRTLLSTFTAVNTDDSGPGSFLQAILHANATANAGGGDHGNDLNIPRAGVHTS